LEEIKLLESANAVVVVSEDNRTTDMVIEIVVIMLAITRSVGLRDIRDISVLPSPQTVEDNRMRLA